MEPGLPGKGKRHEGRVYGGKVDAERTGEPMISRERMLAAMSGV